MITTVQCSVCSQLNNEPRVVVIDFRLVIYGGIIIIISVCVNTPT